MVLLLDFYPSGVQAFGVKLDQLVEAKVVDESSQIWVNLRSY